MYGHDEEHRLKDWVLDQKHEKTPAYSSVDSYLAETNTIYHFHGCYWHRYTHMKSLTKNG